MTVDLAAARLFAATHARLLDRRRLDLALGVGHADSLLAAVEAYRNPDGGYGSGIEPDLRARESQPAGALHAFEVFEETGPLTSPRAVELCDWLAGATRAGGGLPFALPVADAAGCAPFWAGADATAPSLHITCAVTAAALRVARHDAAVAAHPWLARTTTWCRDAIAARDRPASTHELMYALAFLDALADADPAAAGELDRLGVAIPASGLLPVQGGAPDEVLGPLDVAPLPGRPVRRCYSAEVVDGELARLAAGQQDDGGWTVDFGSFSPVATLEWRGYATVRAVRVLAANGALG